jgi:fluoride ion exporter CrcB/FEX
MIEKGQLATAMFYALGSIFIGVVALFAGLYAGKAFI